MDVISTGYSGRPRNSNNVLIDRIPTRVESQTAISVFPVPCCTDGSVSTHRLLLTCEDTGRSGGQAEGHSAKEGYRAHNWKVRVATRPETVLNGHLRRAYITALPQ